MRTVSILLAVCGIMFASADFGHISGGISTPPNPADGTLYEQPYQFAALANGIYVHAPQFGGADNFSFSSEATVRSITFWTVFTSAGHPFDIAVDIYQNTGGTFGAHVYGETVPAAYQTETLTGDSSWEFALYRSDLQLSEQPMLPSGSYWLVMKVLNAPAAVGWLVCDPTYPPNMMQYNSGWGEVAYDGWFGLYDHNAALSRTTWGGIKSVFQH
jgi:hypothetical protein